MLLFILFLPQFSPITKLFQYITCYSLSLPDAYKETLSAMFQYITCYSLSNAKADTYWQFTCFNTSHVTLYRDYDTKLRQRKTVSIHHMLLFIPSGSASSSAICSVSIHHMLLFIPKRYVWSSSLITCFNTSHVTLYRFSEQLKEKTVQVSIHHMLLFIWDPTWTGYCYSCVSIHHMLLFIQISLSEKMQLDSFNTSHVTLYPGYPNINYSNLILFQYITCYSLSGIRLYRSG